MSSSLHLLVILPTAYLVNSIIIKLAVDCKNPTTSAAKTLPKLEKTISCIPLYNTTHRRTLHCRKRRNLKCNDYLKSVGTDFRTASHAKYLRDEK